MQKLSIIIPNSGETKNLRTCIESVIYQSYENIEIILIDGGNDEKFKGISAEIGGNQQETLAKLIEAYEFQAGKAILTENA